MISVVLSVRNNRQSAANCLSSLLRAFGMLGTAQVEYLLIDDASEPTNEIPALFADFRQRAGANIKTTVFRFKQHQHYTRAMAYGFSAARGRHILFVSHDMLVTAEYVRTLLAVSVSDDSIGLVRGTSPYVDCFPQHTIRPPFDLRSFEDVDLFSEYVSQYWGLTWVEDHLLTGDSMLIKREAIEKIGVFDPRYTGYFGDIDFGLRLQRAGLKMVCAKGAWLWHEGAGAYKDQARQTQQDYKIIHENRMRVVNEAYLAFRDKWDKSLPPVYPGTAGIDLAKLRGVPGPEGGEFQPAIAPDATICDVET